MTLKLDEDCKIIWVAGKVAVGNTHIQLELRIVVQDGKTIFTAPPSNGERRKEGE